MIAKPGTAEALLEQRASHILKIQPPHAPPSGSLENIDDEHKAFNALFVNILKLDAAPKEAAAAPAAGGGGAAAFGFGAAAAGGFGAVASPATAVKVSSPPAAAVGSKKTYGETVRITRQVMSMCTPDLLALFTDISLSPATSNALARFAKRAAAQLKAVDCSASAEAATKQQAGSGAVLRSVEAGAFVQLDNARAVLSGSSSSNSAAAAAAAASASAAAAAAPSTTTSASEASATRRPHAGGGGAASPAAAARDATPSSDHMSSPVPSATPRDSTDCSSPPPLRRCSPPSPFFLLLVFQPLQHQWHLQPPAPHVLALFCPRLGPAQLRQSVAE